MFEIAKMVEQNRSGIPVGLPCFCTSSEHAIRAIMEFAARRKLPAVIEATCNQVNQNGGYTAMTPEDFASWISSLRKEYGLQEDQILLGGDHLGPNPWRKLTAVEAMDRAKELVRTYAAAGFRKIHLDASMACGGESTPSFEIVAERAAVLCEVAEANSPSPDDLIYIIGTEVPVPGGETDDMEGLSVTSVDRLQQTLDTHRAAFENRGLAYVWPKIASVVTQPGVDFSHTSVRRFRPNEAKELSKSILGESHLTFEAHSTDYQPTQALAELVAGNFFFLKVGPELTFRMREALFSLANIEMHLDSSDRSKLIEAIDLAMDRDNSNWATYYRGDPQTVRLLRHYSYSDRIRYYWNNTEVASALTGMLSRLDSRKIPETLISQYFPGREFGNLRVSPAQLITDHITTSVERYYQACGF